MSSKHSPSPELALTKRGLALLLLRHFARGAQRRGRNHRQPPPRVGEGAGEKERMEQGTVQGWGIKVLAQLVRYVRWEAQTRWEGRPGAHLF